MKLKRRAAGLGGYLLGAGIFAEHVGLVWQLIIVGVGLVLLSYAYSRADRAPAKPREPRGWMAPREGGYRPRRPYCPIHGDSDCSVLTRHCPIMQKPIPPSGSGGVA